MARAKWSGSITETRTAVAVEGVGVRFMVPRRGRIGRAPRLIGSSRWKLWGLRNVDLTVTEGEVVGLVGPNGSGKTTLLRTIGGIYRPDEGRIRVHGRVAPLLSLSGGLEAGLSGWENIELSAVLLGLSRRAARAISPAVAEFAEIGEFMDSPVRVYSSGMRARLGFAITVFSDPDILLLDEVMAVGDQSFRERSDAKIREMMSSGRTVIITSHEVSLIAELCDRLVTLEKGRIIDQGAPDEVAGRYLASHHWQGRAQDRVP